MSSPSSLALPHVAQLHAYTPGLQPTESGWVKLNTNECPYPPSPRVAAALREEIGEEGASLRLYPNPKSSLLRAAVAKLHGHGLREENVCIGNGSDDILNLLVRAFCSADSNAGYTLPSYSLYPVLVAIQDGRTEVIEFDRSMRLPIEQMASVSQTCVLPSAESSRSGVAAGLALSFGTWRLMRPMVTRLMAPTMAKAVRQPSAWPNQATSGVPTSVATVRPSMTRPMARAR